MYVQSTENKCSNLEQFNLQVFTFSVSSAHITVRNTIKEEQFVVEQVMTHTPPGYA